MREILFKAKRLDNGEWIEGYYQKRKDAFANDKHMIFRCESYHAWEYEEVSPDTICQYTGLHDMHGKKIWENDIVYFRVKGLCGLGLVYWSDRTAQFRIMDIRKKQYGRNYPFYDDTNYRVDGNVFDNPELMERMG